MPIRPERMALYPGGSTRSPEWRALVERIRARSGDRCEGTPQFPDCRAENGQPHPETGAIVVLTVMHMDQNPANNADENLRHGCQRCHNAWDAPHRAANAKRRRAAEAGQGELKL